MKPDAAEAMLLTAGLLGAVRASWLGFRGIEYKASARSAARFKIISLGNFSGSPG